MGKVVDRGSGCNGREDTLAGVDAELEMNDDGTASWGWRTIIVSRDRDGGLVVKGRGSASVDFFDGLRNPDNSFGSGSSKTVVW